MNQELNEHHIEKLKIMLEEKKASEPVEKVLVKFCARHGVSLNTCRAYYNRLKEKGENK